MNLMPAFSDELIKIAAPSPWLASQFTNGSSPLRVAVRGAKATSKVDTNNEKLVASQKLRMRPMVGR